MSDLTRISLFKDCKQVVPKTDILLFDFYYAVQNGDYKTEIEEIRANLEKAKALKMNLPGVTISGTFGERNIKGLVEHSGRIGIDIDAKENPHIKNWEGLRNILGTWKEVEFVSLSASGNGLFIVVPISNPNNHLLHYVSIEKTFKNFGITTDPSCKDIPRLRFMTYDKNAIINENAMTYRLTFKEQRQRISTKYMSNVSVSEIIDEISNRRIDITLNYHNWYQIGSAIASEYGEAGRDLFHKISMIYPKYNQNECDRQYNNCLKNHKGYTIATLFYYAKQFGIMSSNK